jgi:pyruvate dehydrogenase E2 component (dihydrolipoamide acetyltransferase)
VPLNRMRQAIARRMTESKTTAPHFYVTVEINMTEALRMREQLNAVASEAEKVSVNDLVVAAAARTLNQFPNLNASYRDGALERHSQVNIGVAVALEDGLLTPVLHDADKKSIRAIADESKQLSERAKSNKLRAEDLTGSTFTVSNLGMFGVDEFIAIINPPEAAILAVGSATKQPVVQDDQVRIAPMMKATISVDHRVADGAQAARFMAAFRKSLENPMNLLVGG